MTWTQPLLLATISLALVTCYMTTVIATDEITTPPADLDFDESTEENIPHPEALVVEGNHGYRMPGLFGMDGKPFYLEKDPITGAVDFSGGSSIEQDKDKETVQHNPANTKTQLSSNSEAEVSAAVHKKPSTVVVTPSAIGDDYYYDDEEEPLESDNIDRKDTIGSGRPNDLNPYQLFPPDFHEFLNIPIHDYNNESSPSKNVVHEKYYPQEKFPLISSSYANTKVQGTGNNKPRQQTTTTRSPSYYTFRQQPYSTTSIPETLNNNQQQYGKQQFGSSTTHYPPVHYGDFKKQSSSDAGISSVSHPDDEIIYDYYDDVSDTGFGLKTSSQEDFAEEDQRQPSKPDVYNSHSYPSKTENKPPPKTTKPPTQHSTTYSSTNSFKEQSTRSPVQPPRISNYVTNNPTQANRFTNAPTYTAQAPTRPPVKPGQPIQQGAGHSPLPPVTSPANRPTRPPQPAIKYPIPSSPIHPFGVGGPYNFDEPFRPIFGPSGENANQRPQFQPPNASPRPGIENLQNVQNKFKPDSDSNFFGPPVFTGPPFREKVNGNQDSALRQTPPQLTPPFHGSQSEKRPNLQPPVTKNPLNPSVGGSPGRLPPIQDRPQHFNSPITSPPAKRPVTEAVPRPRPPFHEDSSQNRRKTPLTQEGPQNHPYFTTNRPQKNTARPPQTANIPPNPNLAGRPILHESIADNERVKIGNAGRPQFAQGPSPPQPTPPKVTYNRPPQTRPHSEENDYPKLRPPFNRPPPGPIRPHHELPGSNLNSASISQGSPPIGRPNTNNINLRDKNHAIPPRPRPQHPDTYIPPHLQRPDPSATRPRPGPEGHLQRPDPSATRPRPGPEGTSHQKQDSGRYPPDPHYRPHGAPPKTSHPGQRLPPSGRPPYNSLPHYVNRGKPGQEAHAASTQKKPGLKLPDPNLPNILPQFRPNAKVDEKHLTHSFGGNRHPIGLERHDNMRRPYYERLPPPPPPPHLRLRIHRTQGPEEDYSYGPPPRYAHPPGPLVGRRTGPQNGGETQESRHVATLQMMQNSGIARISSRGELPIGVRPPFEVRPAAYGNRPVDPAENRPVFVVYPVNSSQQPPVTGDSAVLGSHGSERPPAETTDDIRRHDIVTGNSPSNPGRPGEVLNRFPNADSGPRPYQEPPRKTDFPYKIERPDTFTSNLESDPSQQAQEKVDSAPPSEEDYVEEEDSDFNIIPYLQDYLPFATKKPSLARRPQPSSTTYSSNTEPNNLSQLPPGHRRPPLQVQGSVPHEVDFGPSKVQSNIHPPQPLVQRQDTNSKSSQTISTTLRTTFSPSSSTPSTTQKSSQTSSGHSDHTPFRITEYPKPTPLIITERLPSKRPQSSGTEITLSAVMHAHAGSDNHRISVSPENKGTVSTSSAHGMSFQAPFYASANVAPSPGGGWSAVGTSSGKERMKPGIVDKADVIDKDDTADSSEQSSSKFDFENFKPQLFGGFKPIFSFPEGENPEKQSRGREEKQL